MGCAIDKPNKIEGYDRYDIENGARTLMDAKRIENEDPKKYAVICKEVKKQADAAMEVAAEKQLAANEVVATKKAGKRLKKLYGKEAGK